VIEHRAASKHSSRGRSPVRRGWWCSGCDYRSPLQHEVTMLTAKPFILAIIAACAVTAGPASNPATAEPPPSEQPDAPHDMKPKDSHWCCQSVDPKTKSGEGCTAFSGSIEIINTCAKYLYCEGSATKDDGKVTCLD
jgi:hypothetical protein